MNKTYTIIFSEKATGNELKKKIYTLRHSAGKVD